VTGIEVILATAGFAMLAFKLLVFLLIAGFVVWALFQTAAIIFKILFYGIVTLVTIAALFTVPIWLLA